MGETRIHLPIACSLEGKAFDARAAEWGKVLAGVVERRSIPGGLELRYLGSQVRQRLLALVEQEQQCCGWMVMRLDENAGDLSLSISSTEPLGERQIRDWFG